MELEPLTVEVRRRTKTLPRFLTEKNCLKLVHATLIRATLRWQRISITPLEYEQLRLLYRELKITPTKEMTIWAERTRLLPRSRPRGFRALISQLGIAAFGIAYAGLRRTEDAVTQGQLALDLLSISKGAYRGVFREEDLAQGYLTVGEFDAAVNKIEYLLPIPGELSVQGLRVDPIWDPLRDRPCVRPVQETWE